MIWNGFMYFQFHFNLCDSTCGKRFLASDIESNWGKTHSNHLRIRSENPPELFDLYAQLEMVIYSIYLFILKKAFKGKRWKAIKLTELIKCRFGSVPFVFIFPCDFSHKNINYFVMIDFALMAAFQMSCSLMLVRNFYDCFLLRMRGGMELEGCKNKVKRDGFCGWDGLEKHWKYYLYETCTHFIILF